MKTLSGMNLLHSIAIHRQLVWEMALRDLRGVGKGALLGHLWLVINPLIQVSAYVVIVTYVFRARLHEGAEPLDYAIYVLSGMVPWQIVSRSLQEAPSLIRDRMDLVKQVIYPIETLPLSSLIFNSFGAAVTLFLLLALSAFSGHIAWTTVLLPLPFALLLVFLLGISWLCSIVGVVFKDLRDVVTVTLGLLVYVSPVVLSEAMVGERIWHCIMWNPLAHIVVCFRDVFYATFHPWSWLVFGTMAGVCLALGSWLMIRAKVIINEYI